MPEIFPLKHGQLVVHEIANPNVATGFVYTPAPRSIEQLYSITYLLDTDANAADRNIKFAIKDGADSLGYLMDDIIVIADTLTLQTWLINQQAALTTRDSTLDYSSHFIPPDLIFTITGNLTMIITNAQVGDQISIIRVVTKTWART